MEKKIFEFMEKLYGEMQSGFARVNKRLDNIEEDQTQMKNDIAQLNKGQARLENDLKPKIEFAFEGYKVVYEKLEILENKVDKLTETVANHDVEIQVIRKVK